MPVIDYSKLIEEISKIEVQYKSKESIKTQDINIGVFRCRIK